MTEQRTRLVILSLEDRLTPSNPSGGSPPGDPSIFGPGLGYSFTNWPDAPLNDIVLTSENTFPVVGPQGQGIRAAPNDWLIRDPFPLTDLDGKLARPGGWYVVAGLATPRNDAETASNGVSTLRDFRYIISRDGVNWQEGGLLVTSDDTGPGAIGDQLFSGDFRYDAANNRVLIYYTPVTGTQRSDFPDSPSGKQIPQEIAVAQVTPVPAANGLAFTDFVQYGVKLRPDGNWYTTPEEANTETEVYAFRDPFFFRDPETGKNYLMFAANWGRDQTWNIGSTGDEEFPDAGPNNVDRTQTSNDGVIGMAVATDDTLTNWRLLPPIFGSIGVNEQLELPHVIHEDGKYYLFVSTHNRTFIGDLKYDYPEGFYGFVANDLQGPYRPLNETSLIFSNPPGDTLQNYAWKAVDLDGGRATVLSFINKGNSGTISPAVTISLSGDKAVISGYQAILADLPQPTVLAFGLSPTAPLGSTPVITAPGNSGGGSGNGNGGNNPGGNNGNGTGGGNAGRVVDGLSVTVSGNNIRVTNTDGSTRFRVTPFDGFTGRLRTATGDVTGDGTDDLIVGAGEGGGPRITVYDGITGEVVANFFAYESTFRGGVYVTAADLDGDGRAEVIAGAGNGGGPRVRVLSGAGLSNTAQIALADFFAYEDTFRGGVQVGFGDLDGDGRPEVLTGAGPGGGPVVKAFDRTGAPVRAFFAGDPNDRGGVTVAGFGKPAEVFVAAGGMVRVYDAEGNLRRSFRAIDGNEPGITPVRIERDSAGRVTVRVSPPDADRADLLFDLNGVAV